MSQEQEQPKLRSKARAKQQTETSPQPDDTTPDDNSKSLRTQTPPPERPADLLRDFVSSYMRTDEFAGHRLSPVWGVVALKISLALSLAIGLSVLLLGIHAAIVRELLVSIDTFVWLTSQCFNSLFLCVIILCASRPVMGVSDHTPGFLM
ncbi:hypothetical protein DL93DRAFT_1807295 [Clavulina sp. PMI_390]|nr:hypothetical protein DL93DRAFT_1807295 [Clavulina sp. PMI_390]